MSRIQLSLTIATASLFVLLNAGCSQPGGGATSAAADKIFTGGPIVTVDDKNASPEALAVKDGKILAAGPRAEIEKAHKGPKTELVDLKGKTLTPGFVDGHTHLAQLGAQAVGANLLAPPDGGVNTIDDVVARLKEFAAGPDVARTGWIFGTGYDDSLLGRHPNRDDLDKVSTEIPVIVVHISGHLCVVNSAGLKKLGISAASKDPVGGVIRRRKGSSEPNGVLEEAAALPNTFAALTPQTVEDKDYFYAKGLELAKSFGYTTANEGRAFAANHKDLADQATRNKFDIDVMSYIDYVDRKVITPEWFGSGYKKRYRIAGLKITLDGSPQGRTAWRNTAYLLPPDGQKPGYKGYAVIPDTKVVQGLIEEAYQNKWPVKVHANGDAAIDQFIAAEKALHEKYGPGDRRHVLIHGQFIRQDQLDSIKALEIFPSLFPMHTFYWGDWYDKIIGPKDAAQISPMRSVLKRGMIATSHTDAPVALPNLMQVMWATVNRVSRSGKVIGPEERVTPIEAFKMITLWGAHQHFEEKTKGSLEPGKLADMLILSANPVDGDPMAINKIVVLETFKEGKSVWKRKL
jgi:predicted amidohydrolase YtcJ